MRRSDGQRLRKARKKYLHLEEIMNLLLYGMLHLMVHFNWLSQSCWFGGLHILFALMMTRLLRR